MMVGSYKWRYSPLLHRRRCTIYYIRNWRQRRRRRQLCSARSGKCVHFSRPFDFQMLSLFRIKRKLRLTGVCAFVIEQEKNEFTLFPLSNYRYFELLTVQFTKSINIYHPKSVFLVNPSSARIKQFGLLYSIHCIRQYSTEFLVVLL